MEKEQLTAELTALAGLMRRRKEFEPVERDIEQLDLDIKQMRANIQGMLDAIGSDRSQPVAGIRAVIATTKNVPKVTDELAVLDWIESNGFSVDEYLMLNVVRVKALAKSALKENGELVPGITMSDTKTIKIELVK